MNKDDFKNLKKIKDPSALLTTLSERKKSLAKGEKGDKGDPGEDGRDGIDGQDGYTPIKGVDYFDGADGKDGVNGKDADEIKIVKKVLNKIPPINTEGLKAEILASIPIPEPLKEIETKDIKGLEQTLQALKAQTSRGYLHGGGADRLTQLQDVRITNVQTGDLLQWNGTKWINTPFDDNGILSLNGLTVATQLFAVGTSGADFNISSVTDTHTFNLPTASATNRGALSSADWSTFNSKQNALPSGTTGQVLQAVTSSSPVWSTATYPSTVTANQILYATGTNTVGGSSSLTFNGTILATPVINATTGFRANGVATTGTILRGDGTNYVPSTATYPDTITADYVLIGTAANAVGQNSNLRWLSQQSLFVGGNLTTGLIGVGVSAQANNGIYLQFGSQTNTSGTFTGYASVLTNTPASASTATFRTFAATASWQGTAVSPSGTLQGANFSVGGSPTSPGTLGLMTGLQMLAFNNGTGTVTIGTGGDFQLNSQGGGTITTGQAARFAVLANNNSVIGTAYGAFIRTPSISTGGSITTGYGLYIETQTGPTTSYSIVSAGTKPSGLGVTVPTAILHLAAGTASASTAPLKFTTGTSLTSAEAGAMEYTTDDLFFTIATGTARKRLLMADPVGGLTSGRVPIGTTNGRLTDSANLTFDTAGSAAGRLVVGSTITPMSFFSGTGVVGTFAVSNNGVSGVDYRNTSNGTAAEFRFTVSSDDAVDYITMDMPGSGNTGTLFGQTRSTIGTVFLNAVSASSRSLAIGTVTSNMMILGTANAERWRIAATTGALSNTGANATAYIHLKAGTTAASTAPLKFTTGTSNTTPEAGAVEYDGNKLWITNSSLTRESLIGALFTQTADKTVTNTVTETSIVGTGVGYGLTLPANFFVAGKTIDVEMSGVYSTVAITGDTVTVKVKYGSTVLASKATTALVTGASNLAWFAKLKVTCRTTGATGTVQVSGGVTYQVAGAAAIYDEINNGAATTTLDTTASGLFDVTVTHSAADASNTVKSLVSDFKVLN